MSVGLDTSVVLRLLTGTPPDQAETARALVAASPSPVVISDLVVGETYFALRHHYAVPHADALRALNTLLADAHVRASGAARTVLAELSTRPTTRNAPGFIDRLIHADYVREDLALATFDRDLARLAGVRRLTG